MNQLFTKIILVWCWLTWSLEGGINFSVILREKRRQFVSHPGGEKKASHKNVCVFHFYLFKCTYLCLCVVCFHTNSKHSFCPHSAFKFRNIKKYISQWLNREDVGPLDLFIKNVGLRWLIICYMASETYLSIKTLNTCQKIIFFFLFWNFKNINRDTRLASSKYFHGYEKT